MFFCECPILFSGAQNLIFFRDSISLRFLTKILLKNRFWSRLGIGTLGGFFFFVCFCFRLLFFVFPCFFLVFIFHCSSLISFDFLVFFFLFAFWGVFFVSFCFSLCLLVFQFFFFQFFFVFLSCSECFSVFLFFLGSLCFPWCFPWCFFHVPCFSLFVLVFPLFFHRFFIFTFLFLFFFLGPLLPPGPPSPSPPSPGHPKISLFFFPLPPPALFAHSPEVFFVELWPRFKPWPTESTFRVREGGGEREGGGRGADHKNPAAGLPHLRPHPVAMRGRRRPCSHDRGAHDPVPFVPLLLLVW